jgi:glc operon protein GlcG
MLTLRSCLLGAVLALSVPTVAVAQPRAAESAPAQAVAAAPTPAPYGAPISFARAEAAVQAALAEARRNNWPVAITVVDGGGHLIAFVRMDGVSTVIVDASIGKAKTSAAVRQPSGSLASWGTMVLAIDGLLPVRGGLPIIIDGRTVGAIGVSGVRSEDDERIAAAGVAAAQK